MPLSTLRPPTPEGRGDDGRQKAAGKPWWLWLGAGLAAGMAAHIVFRGLRPRRPTLKAPLEEVPPVHDAAFGRTLGSLTSAPAWEGNTLRIYDNAAEGAPAMLEAIQDARHHIHLEMFWWRDGRLAERFTEALLAAHARGVKVRLIVDGFGAHNAHMDTLNRLKDAGIPPQVYHRVHPHDLRRWNNRTHRRILVVDGRIGFTGGIGIGDEWIDTEDAPAWRDFVVRSEGPLVGGLQGTFADHWRAITQDVFVGADYFPELERAGDTTAHVLSGGPEGGADHMRIAVMLALAAARERVRVVTPYFVPDPIVVKALRHACERGIVVDVLVPSRKTDRPVARRAAHAIWGALLEVGAHIHEYRPTMVHAKAMVVDGRFAMVGTMNLDERSLRLNAELLLGVHEEAFARALEQRIEADIEDSDTMDHEAWCRRPLLRRLVDNCARLLRTQL